MTYSNYFSSKCLDMKSNDEMVQHEVTFTTDGSLTKVILQATDPQDAIYRVRMMLGIASECS